MYRKIDPRIWNDRKFANLDETAKLVFLFLLTHQHVTCLGAMRANSAGLSREINMDPRRFCRILEQLSALSMLEMNQNSSFIGFPNWLKYNGPEGPNSVVKGWIAALNLLPDCPEKERLISRTASYLSCRSESFRRIALTPEIVAAFGISPELASTMPSDMPSPMASGMPCPIQKQKQKQKQKQNNTFCSERSVTPADGGHDDHSEPEPTEKIPKKRQRRTTRPATQGTGEIVAHIPLVDGTEAPVTADLVEEWKKAFPGVDVMAELARIRAWTLANPRRKKTASGIARFIVGWLGNEQNRGVPFSRGSPAETRRDRSGAPLPPQRKNSVQARVIDGVFYQEEYEIATGKVLRRWPHHDPKKIEEVNE